MPIFYVESLFAEIRHWLRQRLVLAVQFVVGKDGKVTDAKIVKNANYYLDIEALRVVNAMPNWIPGKLEGKTVRVYYTLPVNFRLQ